MSFIIMLKVCYMYICAVEEVGVLWGTVGGCTVGGWEVSYCILGELKPNKGESRWVRCKGEECWKLSEQKTGQAAGINWLSVWWVASLRGVVCVMLHTMMAHTAPNMMYILTTHVPEGFNKYHSHARERAAGIRYCIWLVHWARSLSMHSSWISLSDLAPTWD